MGILLGVFLLFLMIPNRKAYIKSKTSRIILILIIFFNTHYQLDSYLNFQGIDMANWEGISYLYYHLYGFLIFLFTLNLFNTGTKFKGFVYGMVLFTLIRTLFLFYIFENGFTDEEIEKFDTLISADALLSVIMNIVFLLWAFFKLKKIKFAVKLSKVDSINYQWLYRLIIVSIIIYAVILQSYFFILKDDRNLLLYLKLESLILSVFFFAMAYFAIRFPIFSIDGDFKEESDEIQKKYASSSLKDHEMELLWNKILNIITEEKPYRKPDYRLNDLSESTQKSLHHVSQVINEKTGQSFSDFINKYRIEEAKELLLSPETQNLTILGMAYEVGFNSKTPFYNAFKKETGQTPSAFKKNFSKNNFQHYSD